MSAANISNVSGVYEEDSRTGDEVLLAIPDSTKSSIISFLSKVVSFTPLFIALLNLDFSPLKAANFQKLSVPWYNFVIVGTKGNF